MTDQRQPRKDDHDASTRPDDDRVRGRATEEDDAFDDAEDDLDEDLDDEEEESTTF